MMTYNGSVDVVIRPRINFIAIQFTIQSFSQENIFEIAKPTNVNVILKSQKVQSSN